MRTLEGLKHHEGVRRIRFGNRTWCGKGTNALQVTDLVVFCSSEEKRAWKQHHEGIRLREEYSSLRHKHPEGETPGAYAA